MKILKYIILSIAIIVVVIIAIGPTIAVNQLEKNSKEWVGRKLSIGNFSLNLFTGTISIDDFVMYESDDSTIFVAFDRLMINTKPYKFLSNEFVVQQVDLLGIQTYVTQRDTVFNFDDLISFYSSDSTITKEEQIDDTIADGDPMIIEISNVQINAKTLSYTELIIEHETKIIDLNISLPYLSCNTEKGSHSGIEFDLADNGHFGIDVDYNPDLSDFSTDIIIKDLNLEKYYAFAEKELNISSFEGVFDTHLIIKGNLNEIEKLIVKGDINLTDFGISDTNKQKIFGFEEIDIVIEEIDDFNNQYLIESFELNELYVDVELYDNGINFDKLLKEETDTSNVVSVSEADTLIIDTINQNLYYAIKSFKIDNGSVDFIDHTTPRIFKYKLSEIDMEAYNINSDTNWIITHLNMLLNGRGKMKVNLGFNPNKPKDMDVDYVMTDFQLSDINVYSEMNTGYPFVYGEMFYDSKTNIRNGIIKSENKLRINDVEVGDKVEGWKAIPLKLALFILTDKNGDIVLDIPVKGDLNSPDVNVKALVWASFKNVIKKVASSPIDFISSSIGVNADDVKTIEFAYGDTILSNRVKDQLQMLIKIENAKPGLKINMVYINDIEKEKNYISVNEIGKQFAAKENLDYRKHEKEFMDFIKSKTLKDSVNIENDCRQLVGIVAESTYQQYSQKRVIKIQNYLKQLSDSNQIILSPINVSSPKNTGSIPMFEMKYSVD